MLCTDIECFLVVSMCWRRTSFCEKKKKNPSAGSLPSCLMGDLTYFFLEREEEREDRRWRERYRDKVFAQPSQWKNACSRDSVGQECKLICPTESRNISFFLGIDSLKDKSSQYSAFLTVNKKTCILLTHCLMKLIPLCHRSPSLFINYQADTWGARWCTYQNIPSLWYTCTVVYLGHCCGIHTLWQRMCINLHLNK